MLSRFLPTTRAAVSQFAREHMLAQFLPAQGRWVNMGLLPIPRYWTRMITASD